jgi:hypothetical protein
MSKVCRVENPSRAAGSELRFGDQCIPTFSPFAFIILKSTSNLSCNGSMLRKYEPEQAIGRGALGSSQAGAWCGNALGGGSHPSTNGERGTQSGTEQAKGIRCAETRAEMKDYGLNGDCRRHRSSAAFPAKPILCGSDGRRRGLKIWR